MSKTVSVKEVNEILASRVSRVAKPTVFGAEIEALKKGEGFLITTDDWKMKTSPSSYYYRKFNKEGKIKVSCIKTDDGFLIVKK